MGLSHEQINHMTYGQWTDYFERYKKIHNIIVTGSTFKEPRKVDVIFADDDEGWDEIVD